MPGKAVNRPLPSPWKEFFEEIDRMLTKPLAKSQRGSQKDFAAAAYLFKSQSLAVDKLRERYNEKLRAYLIGPLERYDGTLNRWIEEFESEA